MSKPLAENAPTSTKIAAKRTRPNRNGHQQLPQASNACYVGKPLRDIPL